MYHTYTLTPTGHTHFLGVVTRGHQGAGVRATEQTRFRTVAQDPVEPQPSHSGTVRGPSGEIPGGVEAQHLASHVGRVDAPPILADRAPPLSIVVHLHPPLCGPPRIRRRGASAKSGCQCGCCQMNNMLLNSTHSIFSI